MASLGFALLDRHVIDGRGDDVACADHSGTLTFTQLLERSAALAGGFKALGVAPGHEVAVSMGESNLRVVVICACIRLGAVPGDRGHLRIVESSEGVLVHAGKDEHDLELIMRAGRTDPAPSLAADPPGYAASVLENWPILNTFLS